MRRYAPVAAALLAAWPGQAQGAAGFLRARDVFGRPGSVTTPGETTPAARPGKHLPVGHERLHPRLPSTLLNIPGGLGVVIEVEDGGPGIPEDQIEQVVQPFRRLEGSRSRDTGGAGLGLTIAQAIASAHGGSLRLRNSEEGLTASITLPDGGSTRKSPRRQQASTGNAAASRVPNATWALVGSGRRHYAE